MSSINYSIIFIFADVIKSLFLVIMIDCDYEIGVITRLSKNVLVESSNFTLPHDSEGVFNNGYFDLMGI